MVTRENAREIFTYHAPSMEDMQNHIELREAAYLFADTILRLTPVGSDQQAAIRKVREALMTANAAIALSNIQY